MKRHILISIVLLLSLMMAAGCFGKKESGKETTPIQASEEAAEKTTEADTTESDTEEDITPEYVDDYTVEVKEDEVIEFH